MNLHNLMTVLAYLSFAFSVMLVSASVAFGVNILPTHIALLIVLGALCFHIRHAWNAYVKAAWLTWKYGGKAVISTPSLTARDVGDGNLYLTHWSYPSHYHQRVENYSIEQQDCCVAKRIFWSSLLFFVSLFGLGYVVLSQLLGVTQPLALHLSLVLTSVSAFVWHLWEKRNLKAWVESLNALHGLAFSPKSEYPMSSKSVVRTFNEDKTVNELVLVVSSNVALLKMTRPRYPIEESAPC